MRARPLIPSDSRACSGGAGRARRCGEGRDRESVGHGGVGRLLSQEDIEVWEGRCVESVGHGGVGGEIC